MDARWVNVIDVEATCWERSSKKNISDIIEIGLTVFDSQNFEITTTDSIIVKPAHSSVSEFCTSLTTLTPEFVDENGITFQDATNILSSRFDSKRRLFASWGEYDRKIFEKQFQLYRVDSIFGPEHLNIKALFAHCLGMEKQVGMAEALKILTLPLDGTHHRGSDDSRNITKILQYLLTSIRSDSSMRKACESFSTSPAIRAWLLSPSQ